MRKTVLALLALAALALVGAQAAAAGDFEEPVSVIATAPEAVPAGEQFPLSVEVKADPGALDIAAQPLRLRVRFEPECGGSFAGTEGPTAIDRELPAPSAGAAYDTTVSVKATLAAPGPETICAFVEDGQERQFATDTEASLSVVPACPVARRIVGTTKRRLARFNRRLRALKHRRRKAHGAKRRRLTKQIRKLRRKRRRAAKKLHRSFEEAQIACGSGPSARAALAEPSVPQIRHLFVIVLENENADTSFGPNPPAPYLGTTLREAGAYIPNYYGIGHESLDNYIAMVSGQPPNIQTQADCQIFSDFVAAPTLGLAAEEDGVAVGQGCVYPRGVRTIANQLENSGKSWRGYMQDMANGLPEGEPASCRHPAIGASDPTQKARAADQYAARHNPFVYFHSIIDYPTCDHNDVDLSRLPGDLANETTTPAYSFITPDLCSDGHDETCANPALPAGFAGIEAFLREWVPQIQSSAAYKDRGAILVTFDESESGAESCCNEPTGPNTPNNGGPTPGSGGGKVGAVLLSPCIRPGTVTQQPYNHYSFLRWSEDNFGLPYLADAGTEGLRSFGSDVFTKPSCDPETQGRGQEQRQTEAQERAGGHVRLKVRPRRVTAGSKHIYRFRVISDVPACIRHAQIRFAGHRKRTNNRGRARMRLRLNRPGKRFAVALPHGCPRAKAGVWVHRG